jgi:hypothetical protein
MSRIASRISKLGRLVLSVSLVASCLTLTPKMHAQHDTVTVQIPWAFSANNQQFEPGRYQISVLNSFLLQVSNVKTHQSSYLMVSPSGLRETSSQGRLIFHTYNSGDKHYLNQIWMPGRSEFSQLRPTQREQQAQLAAKSTPNSGQVVEALVAPIR